MGLLTWLGFSSSAGLARTAQTVSDVVGQWVQNPAERAAQVDKIMQAAQSDVASARQSFNALPGDSGFSAFADGVNKMMRPVLAVGLLGGVIGWWHLPDMTRVPDMYISLAYAVFGFYFGVVSVVDDLPRGVAKLLTAIRG